MRYVKRYQDASFARVASFEEDADLATASAPGARISGDNLSIWHEGRIPWCQGDRDYNGVIWAGTAGREHRRYRKSIARTVLAASRDCLATWRTDAPSHANPTASSKRLLNGALLGNWGTSSTFAAHGGQHTRYTPMTTVVRYSPHGRSRTSRSL